MVMLHRGINNIFIRCHLWRYHDENKSGKPMIRERKIIGKGKSYEYEIEDNWYTIRQLCSNKYDIPECVVRYDTLYNRIQRAKESEDVFKNLLECMSKPTGMSCKSTKMDLTPAYRGTGLDPFGWIHRIISGVEVL